MQNDNELINDIAIIIEDGVSPAVLGPTGKEYKEIAKTILNRIERRENV